MRLELSILARLAFLLPAFAMIFGRVMIKHQERKRVEQGFWVEYISPGRLRAGENDFAVVYHEGNVSHFFYGSIDRSSRLEKLNVPDEVRWQEQVPDWLLGKRAVVLEHIRQRLRRVEIVAESGQA